MKQKKILALFLTAGLVVSLAACGGGNSSSSDSSDTSESEESADDTADTSDTSDTSEEESSDTSDDSEDASSDTSDDSEVEISGTSPDDEETTDSATDETDISVSEDQIVAAHDDGLGDWESEYSDYAIDGDESFTWGYIDMGYEDVFTTKIRNAFTSYCEKYFPNVTVEEVDGQMDAQTQLDLAESFVAEGVDAILLDPADSEGCVQIVDLCVSEGVPLVAVNSVINSDHLDNGVGFVGSSNYEAGELQAQWLIDNVDDSDTVNMVYQKGDELLDHTHLRYNGLFDTLDEAGYNYDLLSTMNSDYMRDKALTNAEEWVASYGDEVNVVACCNDESCMGSLLAYQDADLADGISFLGIDANQDCLEEVKEGNVSCTIFQNALGQAKWSAVSAYAANTADSTDTTSFSIPFETVDASNVDNYLN